MSHKVVMNLQSLDNGVMNLCVFKAHIFQVFKMISLLPFEWSLCVIRFHKDLGFWNMVIFFQFLFCLFGIVLLLLPCNTPLVSIRLEDKNLNCGLKKFVFIPKKVSSECNGTKFKAQKKQFASIIFRVK